MPRKGGGSAVTNTTNVKHADTKTNVRNKKSNKEEKKLVKNIYIGASNALRWNSLKNKLNYDSDVELVQYLLELADPIANRQAENASDVGSTPEGSGTVEVHQVKTPEAEPEVEVEPPERLRTKEDPAEAATGDSNDSPTGVPSPEDDAERDADWQPCSPRRSTARKPRGVKLRVRRSARNHRHHRKKRHRKGSKQSTVSEVPEEEEEVVRKVEKRVVEVDEEVQGGGGGHQEQQEYSKPAKEDNHKHHHEKHKSSSSTYRGKKKHKRKAKEPPESPRPEKVRNLSSSPPPITAPTSSSTSTTSVHKMEGVEVPPLPVKPEKQEKHRKKHKHRDGKKRSHDIRRAPADGLPVPKSPSPPCAPTPNLLLPPTLELPPEPEPLEEPSPPPGSEARVNGVSTLPPPHLSPIPELVVQEPPLPALPPSVTPPLSSPIPPIQEVEMTPVAALTVSGVPQRVAIRIKLCGDCGCRHVQDACPLLRPAIQVPDALTRSQWSTNASKTGSFSEDSLPSQLLALEERDSAHGLGIIARVPLARYTQFGPLLGDKIREMDIPDDFPMRDVWEIAGSSTERFYLSTMKADRSSWLRFMRPAPTREQRNVAAIVKGGELYFVTTMPLQPGNELLFWLECAAAGWARKKMEKTNCGGCNLRFTHSLYYRLHCSVFHDPNFSLTIRKYHCKVCGLAVLGKENIMRHAAEQHNGKGAYQCQFCKKFFLRLNYLEMHRTYGCAANPQRTRPLCDFCGRKFCQPQKLKVHIKRMHSDMAEVLKEFQCKMCLKLLGSRAALQRHLKEVHHKDLVGACTCDRCGKMFQNKSNLKIHMLTHSGVKPFKCKESNCAAAFTTKQCLQFHYKKVHGYTEENMPKIERCVAYTFDAYAGGCASNTSNSGSIDTGSIREENDRDRPPSGATVSNSPPFTPAGSEGSEAASPAPTIPSLEDEDEEDDEPRQAEIAAGIALVPIPLHAQVITSPSPPPPILRQQVSPALTSPALEAIPCRPGGGILSKASKKWMGDLQLPPIQHQQESPASPEELQLKRWVPSEVVAEVAAAECADKKWSMECLPAVRSPELMTRRLEVQAFARGLTVRTSEQDLVEQIRPRSPSPLGGEFSPLRRSEGEFSPLRRHEANASLLVEAALVAAERDLSGKLSELKPLMHEQFMQSTRLNGLHTAADPQVLSDTDYGLLQNACAKPPARETGLDMSYKQYEPELQPVDLNTEFHRGLRPQDQQNFEQEQGLDMSRSAPGYPGSSSGSSYGRYQHTELQIPPHLHAHHRAAVAAAGLMYEMEPARCMVSPPNSPPPGPPPGYQEVLRHHWHPLPPSSHHHTLDLSTARGQPQPQPSPEPPMSPPPPNYQNYPLSPSPYPPPRANTPTYHHYSGYY